MNSTMQILFSPLTVVWLLRKANSVELWGMGNEPQKNPLNVGVDAN